MSFEPLGSDPSVVVWRDNEDGTATATVDASGPRGFWMARSSVEFGVVYVCNVPFEPRGGFAVGGDSAEVVYPNATYIYTEPGTGKRFKVLAEVLP